MKYLSLLTILMSGFCFTTAAQDATVSGYIKNNNGTVAGATILIASTAAGTVADTAGYFRLFPVKAGTYHLQISAAGYLPKTIHLKLAAGEQKQLLIVLEEMAGSMEQVVITGTMKPVKRVDSPIPIEVYTAQYFRKNPTASLFEAAGMINGVRPQLNCNICNTGDIHINGMEGPYTLILIDGMPIVSGLSTVYGLSGIPNSLVERLEVVKGPAASLYGSEAIGGIINVITKSPDKAPLLSADVFTTSWREYNTDVALKWGSKKLVHLTGVSYYHYGEKIDRNKDGFTDVALQKRISVFNKTSFTRKKERQATLAGRYVYEDRWGGQTSWNKSRRGSDSIYGESIYTRRWELIGKYQLPLAQKIFVQASYNQHRQDACYGTVPYAASQQVAFAQMYWDKLLGDRHNLLAGVSYRYTFYDDNTPATATPDGMHNSPQHTPLPGVFIQDEWTIAARQKLLLGYRYDRDRHHGSIHSPRIAYRWSAHHNHTVRASMGTGFRVVNLFTEDHAALTGAREVVIKTALKPEKSYNANLNYVTGIRTKELQAGIDITAFYSYFTNKITGDFDSDPDKIIYDNLNGYAVSRGVSLNNDISVGQRIKLFNGVTFQDVYQVRKADNNRIRTEQVHAPKWSGNFTLSYAFSSHFTTDITGQWNGPMRLPVQLNDYRPAYSPFFSIINIQCVKLLSKGLELYGGVKNILNFVPRDVLMRPFDPFDKQAADLVSNPNAYTFDTEYNYAPLQGIRGFVGLRYSLATDYRQDKGRLQKQ